MNTSSDFTQDNEEVSLYELMVFLWGNKLSVILVGLFFSVVAASLSFLQPNQYKAEAVVQVKGSGAKAPGGVAALAGVAAVAGVSLGGDQSLEATLGVLRSRELKRDFIRKYELVDVLIKDGLDKPELVRLEMAREKLDKVFLIVDDKKTGLVMLTLELDNQERVAEWLNGFVALANDYLRDASIDRAQKSLIHLNKELPKAEVVAVQQAMYRLIEEQVKSVMVATVEREFAIRVIDPAVEPVRKSSPKRALTTILAGIVGSVLTVIWIFFRQSWQKIQLSKKVEV